MVRGVYDYDGEPRIVFDGHYVYDESVIDPEYDIDPVPESDRLDVAISGGSMGGLFTAHALRRAGHAVDVYERTAAGEMRSRGAGIFLFPQLLEYMERNGLADRDEVVLTIDGVQYLDESGDTNAEFDQTVYTTSWDTTYRSLRNSLPADTYHHGRTVVGTGNREESVTVRFEDGERVERDLAVVAEGYRSSTRGQLLPGVELEYAGYVAWRGIAPARTFPPEVRERFDEKVVYFQGPDYQINGYPVPSPGGSTDPEDRRINLVWYAKVPPGELDDVLLDREGNRRDGSVPPGLLRDAVWERQIERAEDSRIPDVFTRLVRAYDEPYLQCIYDLATTRMVVGRVCIVGDAAFFIRPHMAAGTSHAAADGLTLAEALSSGEDLDAALSTWEDRRLEIGRDLVERAKERGDRFLQL